MVVMHGAYRLAFQPPKFPAANATDKYEFYVQ